MPVTVPRSLDDALDVIASDPSADLLGGGTDLMVAINAGRHRVTSVVALDRVPELRAVRVRDGQIEIGAGVTFTDLLEPDIADVLPGLAQAARTVGSPQIRNAGTIGGNLATASPAGDALPMLLALGADVVLRSRAGERTLPIETFLVGPKRTALGPGELIAGVRIRLPRGPQEFLKVGTRNAMVISVCSVAVVADLDTRSVRVGLGSVGPTVLRAPEAEDVAASGVEWDHLGLASPSIAASFGRLVSAAARPIDDHRATAAYRRHCVGVLAERALFRMFPGGVA